MKNNVLLAVALAAVGGDAAALSSPLVERAACNRDNLFRCFIDQRYFEQAIATVTATATTTVETELTADAVISTETLTTTVFTETVATATTTLTLGVDALAKREASVNPPKCMTNGVTYPASRITSACSCIDVPASTVSVTHTAGTETVTETSTVFIAPSATTTTWTTVSTATSGVQTVTVGPPGSVNRISSSTFQDGTLNGWELVPDTWKGAMRGTASDWVFALSGTGEGLGTLRFLQPIYLEAGRYRALFTAPILAFPSPSGPWGQYIVYDIANPTKGTNITVTFAAISPKKVYNGKLVIWVEKEFEIPESAAGYSKFSLRYLARPPAGGLGDISIQKIN
ncbi:hypothetical protein ACHAPT_011760 [Fusarium lateritium]